MCAINRSSTRLQDSTCYAIAILGQAFIIIITRCWPW